MDMTGSISIGDRQFGGGAPCLLIAEVAQAHDGSLGQAHALVDAAADVGADVIKFQTHIAAEESTLEEPFRVNFSRQDETRYAYWKRMEFTEDQWKGLAIHARERGLLFMSSPFSDAAVKMLHGIGVPAWKLGSGEVYNGSLINLISQTGLPVLISTGMSYWHEIDEAVKTMANEGIPYAVFQCTSKYPTPLEQVGVNVIQEMRERYQCPVGLSDHSGNIYTALMALAQGCDMLELHVTFDRRMFGPDTSSSVTFQEFEVIHDAREAFYRIAQNPVDKDALARSMGLARSAFGKSLAPIRTLEVGTIIDESMLTFKKPATGLKKSDLDDVIGKRLVRRIEPKELIRWSDLEL